MMATAKHKAPRTRAEPDTHILLVPSRNVPFLQSTNVPF